jgi:hypothetical protein
LEPRSGLTILNWIEFNDFDQLISGNLSFHLFHAAAALQKNVPPCSAVAGTARLAGTCHLSFLIIIFEGDPFTNSVGQVVFLC